MPNHVHVVFCPMPDRIPAARELTPLAAILHSWKSFSAQAANRALGRTGAFWQREYYDHLIRDEADYKRCVNYTLNNPVKAGLCETWEAWPWTGFDPRQACD
jgi:REP element-mobilizing transposase RayT